jgi:class 3 adenylate cyclase
MTLPPSHPYPEERRLATVLFADIQGFTQLAEEMDFEDVSDLIKDVWQRLDSLLEQNGAYIDKHIGDAVMAVWGAPRATEHDAERAVTAALALQAALREFAASSDRPGASTLKLRVGLNTGFVLAGYVGTRNEYTVMGDTVNVASRLETTAEPSTVVISAATYQLVRDAFQIKPLAPLNVKGKTGPLMAFLVEGPHVGPRRARYGGGPAFETHMVARDEEMARLYTLYQQIRASRQPRLVCVEGEMGLGKSRLLMEFSRRLEQSEAGLLVLSARCQREFRRAPFYLWKSLWFGGFGLTDDDPPQLSREKFVHAVQGMWGRQLGPVSSLEVAHTIGGLIGIEWPGSPYLAALQRRSPEVRLKRGVELMRELLRRMAIVTPLVMILDDLQWLDEASRDLLVALLEPQPEPLALPVLSGIRAGRLADQPQLAQTAAVVRLKHLPISAEVVAQAYPRLATLPQPMRLALAERAAGNPYFLEEMVKSLFAGRPNGPVDPLTAAELNSRLPESLQAMLQARLDALSPDARSVVLLASVVGRVFWVGAVEAAALQSSVTGGLWQGETAGVSEKITRALAEIVKAELAFPRAGSAFAGEPEYIFKHSVLCDVAYGLLPRKHVRQYHQAVARWLGTRTKADMAATVGAHLEAAGDYRAAAERYDEAAQYALSRGADDEGAWLSARALSIRDQPPGTRRPTEPLHGTDSLRR